VNVGAPQGSRISALLFLLYVSPLHFKVPRGLIISYVNDFALTAASPSYRGNIRRLQKLVEKLEAKALRIGVSFSVAKTELIHWRTPSQRNSPRCLSPIQIKGELFRPCDSLRWLRYWFTPALASSAHFSRRLALAQGAFALIRHLSPPGAGLAPYLCHRLATSLVAPILLYGSDLFTPSAGAMLRLNTFWHKVQRWTTNCFSATPTGILALESCLPPVALLISQRPRLAALRVVCSPPELNRATAHLHTSFPSLSAHLAHDSSRALTRGLLSVYLPLHQKTPRPVPPLRNHLRIDAVAHKTIPFTHGLSRMPMINSHISKKSFFSGRTEHASGRITSALCVRSSRISHAFYAFHFLRLVHPDAPLSLPSLRHACCSPTTSSFLPLVSAPLSSRLLASCLLLAVARVR